MPPKRATHFSYEDFPLSWNYAIAQDFHSADDAAAQWAPGHPVSWGSEAAKLSFSSPVASTSLNADGSVLAFAVGHDIHIYNVSDRRLLHVLKGHTSDIDNLEFSPRETGMLASNSDPLRHSGSSDAERPQIMFWDLDSLGTQHSLLAEESTIRQLGQRAIDAVAEGIAELEGEWRLQPSEQDAMATAMAAALTRSNIAHLALHNPHIHGRLCPHFGARHFSHDGKSLLYLPGDRAKSNSDVPWPICVLDLARNTPRLTLTGHTDAIMWLGFSPDDALIGSAAWDGSFRIWDSATGTALHVFATDGQNWTAGFSPDSALFAGTTGTGSFRVWDLHSGAEVAAFDVGKSQWCRTLDWSPDGRHLAIGGRGDGMVMVVDPRQGTVLQQRSLSVEESAEEYRHFLGKALETKTVRYLAGGRRIAWTVSMDHALEMYDFVSNEKWRFAPPPRVKVPHGSDIIVLAREGMIASVEGDVVRFWEVKSSEGTSGLDGVEAP